MHQDELEAIAVKLQEITRKINLLESRLKAVEKCSPKGKKEGDMTRRMVMERKSVEGVASLENRTTIGTVRRAV